MKNLVLGIALVSFAFGCKSNKNASVSDPAAANMPKAACCADKAQCTEAQKAQCQDKKACCQQAAVKPQN